MNTASTPGQTLANNTPLWAAIGVLGVAVVVMGVTLIRNQSPPVEASSAAQMASAPVPALALTNAASQPGGVSSAQTAAVVSTERFEEIVPNKPPAPVHKAQIAPKTISNGGGTAQSAPQAKAVPLPKDEPAVARAPEKLACANCGTIERVTPVVRDGEGSGVGVVAGGVLGAVVGNQVGGGTGKTLATVLGAVGGGLAGNAVEKKMKKVTHYQVAVRMEDGSTRTVDQAAPASVGARVIVEGNTLSPISR